MGGRQAVKVPLGRRYGGEKRGENVADCGRRKRAVAIVIGRKRNEIGHHSGWEFGSIFC